MNFPTSVILQIVATFSPRGKYGAIVAMVLGLWFGACLSSALGQCLPAPWSLNLANPTITCGTAASLGLSPAGYAGNGYILKWKDGSVITRLTTRLQNNQRFSFTYPEPGVYRISLIRIFNSPACRDSAFINITVVAPLAPVISVSNPCEGQNMVLTASNTTPSDTIVWFEGTSTIPVQVSTQLTYTTNKPVGTYQYSAMVRSGPTCSSALAQQTVVVQPVPAAPTFTITNNNACGPATVGFVVTSPVAGTSYIFRVGHNNQELYTNSGQYTYPAITGSGSNPYILGCLAVANGCTSVVASQVVTVKQVPDVGLKDLFDIEILRYSNCDNFNRGSQAFTIDAYDNSTTRSTNVQYTFDWGDGTSNTVVANFDAGISHVYQNEGVYTLRVTALGSNGCTYTRAYQVLNISNPAMGLSNPGGTNNLCTPLAVGYILSDTTYSNHSSTIYTITWGDGKDTTLTHAQLPIGKRLFHTWDTTSCGYTGNKFTISFKAENACNSTLGTIDGATTLMRPRAAMSLAQKEVCVNNTVTLNNTSRDGFSSNCVRNTIYSINWGDGSANTSYTVPATANRASTHVYAIPGKYRITITATAPGCGQSVAFDSVCVSPTPIVSFRTEFPGGAATTCTGQPVFFRNTTNLVSQPCGKPQYRWLISNMDSHSGCDDPAISSTFFFLAGSSTFSTSLTVAFRLPGQYRVRLVVTNPCSVIQKDTFIIIKGRPYIGTGITGVGNYCVGQTITPAATASSCNGNSATTYSWLLNNVQISTSATLAPLSQAIGSYTLSLIATNECGNDTATVSYNVGSRPVITAQPQAAVICEGAATQFIGSATTTGAPATLSYQWQQSTNNGSSWQNVTNGATFQGATTATLGLLSVRTNQNGLWFRLTASGLSGCSIISDSARLTVNAKAIITGLSGPVSVCNGGNANLTVNASGTSLQYQWQLSTNNGTSWTDIAGANSQNLRLVNIPFTGNNLVYRARLTTYGVCDTVSATIRVTVLSAPIVTSQPVAEIEKCIGETIVLSGAFSGANVVRWYRKPPGASTWTILNNNVNYSNVNTNQLTINGLALADSGTQYRLRGVNSSTICETFTDSSKVRLNPLPSITANPSPSSDCEGDTISFTAIVASVPGVASYQWEVANNVGGPYTPVNNGVNYAGANTPQLSILTAPVSFNNTYYQLRIISNKGCVITSAAVRLRITTKPVLLSNLSNVLACEGDTARLSLTATGNSLSYIWQQQVGAIWVNLANNAVYSGVTNSQLKIANVNGTLNGISYRLVVTNTLNSVQCQVISLPGTLTIRPASPATITATNTTLCEGGSLTLNANTGTNLSYRWFRDGLLLAGETAASLQLTNANPAQSGVYQVEVTNNFPTTGCPTNSAGVTIIVNPQPIITLLTPSPLIICQGSELKLVVQSVSGTTYKWFFNNTAIVGATNPTYIVASAASGNAGNYRVEITNTTTLCKETSSIISVTVNPQPIAYTVSGGGAYCAGGTGLPITLSNSQAGVLYRLFLNGTYTGTQITGTGSNISFTTVTNAGSYTVLAFSGVGCSLLMSGSATVTITPLPIATITTAPVTICTGSSFTLNANNGTGLSYQWFKNGTAISGATNAQYGPVLAGIGLSGSYTVRVTSTLTTLNCFELSNPVTVTVNPRPSITAQPVNATVCENGNTSFSVVASGTPLNYQWQEFFSGTWTDISGASISQFNLNNVTLSQNSRRYRARIINANNCDTISREGILTVNPLPNASITSSKSTICLGETVTLTASGGITYTWDTDLTLSTTSGAVVTAKPTSSGTSTYFVTVTDNKGCSKQTSIAITVNSLPVVTLVTTGPLIICQGSELKLVVQSVPGTTYQWFFNNTAIVGATNPTYRVASAASGNAGNYRVEITNTTTLCKETSSIISVTVNPQPIAYTVSGGGAYCAGGTGLPITLSNSQSGVLYRLFLNGTYTGTQITGIGSGISFTGITTAGSYTVSAVSSLACNISMIGSANVIINPLPNIGATASQPVICDNDTTTLTATGGLTYAWSGAGLLSNTGNSVRVTPPGTSTYQVIGTDINGCTNTFSVTVIVNPRAGVIASPTSQLICSGDITGISLSSNVAGATFAWTATSSSGLVSGFSNGFGGNVIQQTLVNNTTSPQTVTYSVVGTAIGCIGAPTIVVVTIAPAIVITQPNLSFCSGEPFVITPTFNLSGTTFDLNVISSNLAITGFIGGTNLTSSNQILVNTTSSVQTMVVGLTPKNGVCTGSPITAILTIRPKPVVIPSATVVRLCGTGSVTINFTNTVGVGTYNTTLKSSLNTVGASSPGAGDSFTQTLTNTSNSLPGQVVYQVVATVAGCNSDTVSITVQLDPTPIVQVVALSDTICSEDQVSIQLSSTVVGSTYTWTTTTTGSITGAASGSGSSINQVLINNSSTSIGTVSYRISVFANGCQGKDSVVVIVVKPLPVTAHTPNSTSFCISGQTNITLSASIPGSAISWLAQTTGPVTGASSGIGNRIVQQLTNASRTDIGYVRYIATSIADGCVGKPDTVLVQVNPKPLAGFAVRPDTTYCINTSVNLTNTTLAINGTTISYVWDFGNGRTSAAINGSVVYAAIGQYTIRLIATSAEGCADTTWRTIRLVDIPRASFTKTTPASDCAPVTVSFANTSYAPAFDASPTYFWDFGNGQTSSGPSGSVRQYLGSPKQDTTYYVTLTVTGRCGISIYRDSVKVLPRPTARFLVESDTVCARLPVRIANNSIGQATRYRWSFGDGSPDSILRDNRTIIHSFQHFGSRDTTFFVRLIASNLCGIDTVVQPVVVRPNAVFALFNTDRNAGCTPLAVNFTSNQSGSAQVIWIWGDGQQDVGGFSRRHTYLNNTGNIVTYRASIIAFSGTCSRDTFYKDIVVHPLPLVSFRTNKRTICLGDTIRFTNTSATGISSFWTLGDNTTSTARVPSPKIYTAPGVYRITLRGTNTGPFGCVSTFTDSVLVLPSPIVRATYTTDTTRGCEPLRITFRLQTIGALSWRFDFGDGNSVANQRVVTHTYLTAGTYRPRLVVEGVCNRDSIQGLPITVAPSPLVRFVTDRPSYCQGDTLYLTNQSALNLGYRWSSSGSWTSNLQNPTSIALRDTGLFTITLRGRSLTSPFCESVFDVTVRVHPKPIARFSGPGGVVLQACQGQPVNFINQSIQADQVLWNFGVAGATSLARDPSYTYTGSGIYMVLLTVYSTFGCLDTVSRFVNVYPAPAPAFSLSDTAGCSPLTISFTNQTGYPNQLQGNLTWHLGNGLLFNGHSSVPSQTYINTTAQPVQYRIVLYATTTFGCRDSVVKTITVFPRPKPAFVILRDTLNQDSAVFTFLNRTRPAGNWTYTWRWGDGRDTTVTDTLPIAHRYDTVGRMRVSLLVVTPNGCRDSVVRFVVIRPVKPIVSFVLNEGDTVIGCRPLTISVKNQTRYGRDYRWDFGNGVLYNVAAPPPVTYYNAGVYSIKLLVRNAAGNDSLIRRRVVVAEDNPKAAFSLSPAEVVVPDQATQFLNLSRGATSYRWNFGDGSTSEEVSPRYTYQDTGRFNVTLIAATRGGCLDTFTIRQAVTARFDGRIVVPNAFTPLSTSGLNDVFLPKMDGAIAYRMLIFSRWGEILFESTDPNTGWDGRHRGQMCTPDQYVYRIEVTFSNGISKTETGKVYLVR